MADVLFVTWDGGGNVPPALGMAAELQSRGHAVRFLGHAQQRPTVEAAGFPFTPYVHARPWSSTAPAAGLSGAARVFAMFTDPGPGLDLLDSVTRRPADLVVLDCMSLGALAAAEQAGLPRAVLVHTYYRYLTAQWSRGPVGAVARLRGQSPRRLWAGADLVLVASDRGLDPVEDEDLPTSVRHTGVVQPVPLRRRDRVGGSGWDVLVSLSTTFYPGQDRALQRILDALGQLPVRAVATTGMAVDAGRLSVPPNVQAHQVLPHAQVMPLVRLVVGHGGHATTMRALSHDLPLLVLPMHPMLDQKMIGRSVEQQGAGQVLAKSASPQEICTAVERLLAPGPHCDAAALLGRRLRAQSGAVSGADHLVGLLG